MHAGPHREPNRLIDSVSPYLLQHAYNPVDWYPWSEEALQKARREDKLIFLSIGYSSCHWCHVMEREVFVREDVAEALKEGFVSIKVDREERPDLDAEYMLAAQAMTGSGGWPLSAFLEPESLKPLFAAGRYFPPGDFLSLIGRLLFLWRTERQHLSAHADEIASLLDRYARQSWNSPVRSDVAEGAVSSLAAVFDREWGGFGTAPKFPMVPQLLLLADCTKAGHSVAADMLHTTLEHMLRGGIHDHVGGGFFRYSTDRKWLVPHFEKMLYDQGLMANVLAEAYSLEPHLRYRVSAERLVNFLLNEMRHPEGPFFSSIDADSEGEEGKYYTFVAREVSDVLGSHAEMFCQAYGVTEAGNFEHGRNVLSLTDSSHDVGTYSNLLEALAEARRGRVRPDTDGKIVTAWNALAVSGLCAVADAIGITEARTAAANAVEFMLAELVRGDVLYRVWRDGKLGPEGFLADYAYLVHALLTLYDSVRLPAYADAAVTMADAMLRRFTENGAHGLSEYVRTGEHFMRMSVPQDGAEPSANGIAVLALLRLAEVTGDTRYRSAASDVLRAFGVVVNQSPSQTATLTRATFRVTLPQGRVDVIVPDEVVLGSGGGTFEVKIKVPGGCRVYGDGQNSAVRPLSVALTDCPADWSVRYHLPDPVRTPEGLTYYHGDIGLQIEVTTPPRQHPASYGARVVVRYQLCTEDACLPIEEQSFVVGITTA